MYYKVKFIIDTSSLISLCRYYLVFDKDRDGLKDFFKEKFFNKEIIILDKVYEECNRVIEKLVIKTFNWETDKPKIEKVSDKNGNLTINLSQDFKDKFYKVKDGYFIEYKNNKPIDESQKNNMVTKQLNSTDVALIGYCESIQNNNEKVLLVTEETNKSNDKKPFRKIPYICEDRNINCITLPMLM